MALETSLFDYLLPASSIAQHPAKKRDHSRLLVVIRASQTVEHRHFYELPEILSSFTRKAVFFRNTAKVIKARLWLERKSGGKIELLLLRPSQHMLKWWCLAKPLKKISAGEVLFLDKEQMAKLKEKSPAGEALFEFFESPLELSEKIGTLPLPPYISRKPHDENEAEDVARYQTIYAQEPVAAAAPTAGLHFTSELINKLKSEGHYFADLTLHVGLDTFRPITEPTIEAHPIHTETYSISAEAIEFLKSTHCLRLAVGTTSLRTMEDFSRKGFPPGQKQSASIFVYPPQQIISADALITNFHLPKSTLLCLVSAFLTPGRLEGISWLKSIYAEALKEGYRFYSYGDAMLII